MKQIRAADDRAAINGYANAMFRFERLHPQWIDDCADYLVHLFGKRLRNATVVDYGCGRGNWSAAFLRAGAARVVAVDASRDNVRRLDAYCRSHRLGSLEVVHGNIVTRPMTVKADIVWAHGILHHVPEADTLVARLAHLARNEKTVFHMYAYDAGSLRQWVVSTARRAVALTGARGFDRISLLFAPAARLRARDDLTAPHITWYEGPALARLFRRHGLHVMREDRSFPAFQHGRARVAEFEPYHLLCSADPKSAITISRRPGVLDRDIRYLSGMADALLDDPASTGASRRQLGIGLMNTHFTALDRKDARAALVQDYLYLFYCLAARGITETSMAGPARAIVRLGQRALDGSARSLPSGRAPSFLEAHLASHTIRI